MKLHKHGKYWIKANEVNLNRKVEKVSESELEMGMKNIITLGNVCQ